MDIREKAASWLSRCSRSEKELTDYLARAGYERDEIEDVIYDFRQYGYIDDKRYAAEFVRYGIGKRWADFRIISELKKKGVSGQYGKAALEEMEDDEEYLSERERAAMVAEKIVRGSGERGRSISQKLKGKISRRLSSYGYSTAIIYDTLDSISYMEEDFE